jgi:hypothetical protein
MAFRATLARIASQTLVSSKRSPITRAMSTASVNGVPVEVRRSSRRDAWALLRARRGAPAWCSPTSLTRAGAQPQRRPACAGHQGAAWRPMAQGAHLGGLPGGDLQVRADHPRQLHHQEAAGQEV